MPPAEPDYVYARMLRGISRHAILHTGSGELIFSVAGATLHNTDQGFALLRQDGQPDTFLFEKMQYSFHKYTVDGKNFYYRHHKETRVSETEVDYGVRNSRSVAFFGKSNMRDFSTEVFISEVPRGEACVRWSLPRVLDETIGLARDARWLGRHGLQLRSLVEVFIDTAENHFFPSTRSVIAKFAGAEEPSRMSEAMASEHGDREYTASTMGLIMLLSLLPHRNFKQFGAPQGMMDGCIFVLSVILGQIIGNLGKWRATVCYKGKQFVFEMDGAQVIGVVGTSHAMATLLKVVKLGCNLASFFASLAGIIHKQSKYPSCSELAHAIFLHLSRLVADEVETSRCSRTWTATDGILLEPTRRPGSRKCRRISFAFKKAVQNAIKKGSYLRSAQQLLAAKGIIAEAKHGKSGKSVGPKAGLSFLREGRLQYVYACRKTFRNIRHLSFCCDGTTIGGSKWLQIVGWSPEKKLGFWSVPQVERKTKYRNAMPGDTMAPTDKDNWHDKTVKYMKRKSCQSEATAASKSKRAKTEADAPRTAAWSWMMKLQNSFESTLGFGLERWIPQPRALDDDLAAGEACPSFLVGCFDQENLQWSAAYFLTNKLGGQMIFMPGPMHRLDNDCDRAVIKSGEYMTMLLSMCCGNVVYGPWANQEHYQTILETAWEACAGLSEDNPFLMYMWPKICLDRQWTAEEDTNGAARRRFLRDLAQERPISVKGPRSSTGRWMSMHSQAAYHDPTYHTRLFVFGLVIIMNGWETSWSQLFDSAGARGPYAAAAAAAPTSSSSSAQAGPSNVESAVKSAVVDGAQAAKKKAKAASTQKAEDSAKARTLLDLNGCKNMLHACARIMAKPDFVERLRLIVPIFRPMRNEQTATIKQLRTVEGTYGYYSGQAQWQWMLPLQKALGVLTDLSELKRAGFTTDLNLRHRQSLTTGSPEVALEDSLARRAWTLATHLLSERASSMVRYTSTYPFKLAAVLSSDPEVRQTACDCFAHDWRCYASASTIPLLKDKVDRCSLSSRAMHDIARVFRRAGWVANQEVVELMRNIFGGYGQEKICEDVLKHCREAETRDQSSQIIKNWRVFDAGSTNKVIESWGREEITVDCDMHVDKSTKDTFVFRHDGKTRQGLDLPRIKGTVDWVTWDAQTVKRQAAIDELLRHAFTEDNWEIVPEAWRARIIPERQILLNREKQEMWFAVYSTDYMVLAWPCSRVANRVVVLDRMAEALQWKVVLDLRCFEVVACEVVSPLHTWVRGDVGADKLGICVVHSNPVPLLEWQAAEAFANVPLSTMRRLAADLRVPLHDEGEVDLDMESVVAMDLMMAINGEMPAEEAQRALIQRPLKENRGILKEDVTGDAPISWLMECMSRKDAGIVKEFQKDIEMAKANHEKRTPKVVNTIATVVGKTKKKGRAQKITTLTPEALHAKLTNPKGWERWWNGIQGNATRILEGLPPGGAAKVYVDDRCGRFLVSYGPEDRRSFSWTKRGMKAAQLHALRFLWDAHEKCTGQKCPGDLAALQE